MLRDQGAGKGCPGGTGSAEGVCVPRRGSWGNCGCVVASATQGTTGLGLPCAEQTQDEGELAQKLFSVLVCMPWCGQSQN